MAKKRMYHVDIVTNDVFLDMPLTSQALYFHLGMQADDDGFVSPKRVMRMIGAGQDDLQILIAKRYILAFESGIVVIKHWRKNNTMQGDRYAETTYQKEKALLTKNEWGQYTEIERITTYIEESPLEETKRKQNVSKMVPQTRLDEIRIDKNRELDKSNSKPAEKQPAIKTKEIDDMFLLWESEVGYALTARRKMNREYASKIIKEYPPDDIRPMLKVVGISQDDQYAPRVSDFIQLYRKWDDLKAWVRRKKAGDKPKIARIS